MNDQSQHFPWFDVAGEVASLLRRMDWSNCPIGPPETWPHQLHTLVALALQSQSPAAVVWGHQLNTLYNDAYALQLGDKHPAALSKSFSALWSEIWPEITPVIDNALAGKSSYFEDVPYTIQPNGIPTQRWYTSSFVPVTDSLGAVGGIYITAIETTRRMQAERRYAFQSKLTERLRHLSASTEITAAASELIGKYLGVGRVVYAAADESGETVSTECDWTDGKLSSMAGVVLRLDDFGPLMARAIRAGEDLVVADVTTDERSAAYTNAYADRGIRSCLAIPLMKEGRLRVILNLHDSHPHYWSEHEITLAQDMVDRTWSAVESARSQTELRAERDQSQYIFDNMTEGFGLIDRDWTVLYVNAAGLHLGHRTQQQVIGRSHWEGWPDTLGTDLERLYRQVMQTRSPGTIEFQQDFQGGHAAWLEVTAFPAMNDGLATFFRDITTRKQYEEKLKDADQRKDEFLAMLAHELRNPLAPIGAAAELLQMVKLDEARVRQTSQVIGRQVQHMTSLVDDLLDVSRVTRGLVELDIAPLDIRYIVADAVEQVTSQIQSRRHHFALHLPPDTTMVMGDKKRLVQVIANILNNAAKYTQEGGNIVLRVEVHAEHVVIEVRDNGIGMTPELAGRAFDLFAQAERSSDRSSGGLGLGLALVKSLIELHHGTVACESAGLAKGSKFAIRLPRLNQEPNQAEQKNVGSHMQQETNALRIMVVDDNADAASMLAMLLEAAGHHVIVEHGARQALERASIDPPQVFLLDIGLPEIDGNELAQRLRVQPETTDSILVAVTGYGQEKDRQQALAAGFDHHLVKPVDTVKLAALLAKVGDS